MQGCSLKTYPLKTVVLFFTLKLTVISKAVSSSNADCILSLEMKMKNLNYKNKAETIQENA